MARTSSANYPPDDAKRIGTKRRDAYGNQIPGEFNEMGLPIGNPTANNQPMSKAHDWGAFDAAFRGTKPTQGEAQTPTPTATEKSGDTAQAKPVVHGVPNGRSAFRTTVPLNVNQGRAAAAIAAGSGSSNVQGEADRIESMNRQMDANAFNAGRGGPQTAARVAANRAGAPMPSQVAQRTAFNANQTELNAQLDTGTRAPADAAPMTAFEGTRPVRVVGIDPRYQTPGASPLGVARSSSPAPAPANWQQSIVQAFPAIGVAGSPENAAFVKAFREGGHTPDTAFQVAHNLFGRPGQNEAAPAPATPAAVPAPFAVTPQQPTAPAAPAASNPAATPAYSPFESPAVQGQRQAARNTPAATPAATAGVRDRAMNKLMANYPGVDPKSAPRADTTAHNITATGKSEAPLGPFQTAQRKIGEWTMGAAGKASTAMAGTGAEGSAFDTAMKKISGREQAPVAPFKKVVTAY